MTARILVVDDVQPNLKLLETRLNAEYFEVLTATNGLDAIAVCEKGGCDIVLLDVMMPGMDGFEVCRRLRTGPDTAHLPIVLVTALDRSADRVRGLEAGADDFLTKPVDEVALVARVRSLARLKLIIDELRSRARHGAAAGFVESIETLRPDASDRGRVLLVDDQRSSFERIVKALSPHHDVIVTRTPSEALAMACEENVDLMIISLGLGAFDGLNSAVKGARMSPREICPSFSSLIATIARRFCVASNSASTTTCPARSNKANCWRACAQTSGRSAMPTDCANPCSNPWSWRSMTR